jgi:proton-translocating NADH-quinone oxidoreductase chain L
MPTPALLLVIATLLPLAGFALLLFVGRRMGTPLAGYVGTAFIGASFVCTILAMIAWYGGGTFRDHDWGFEKGPIDLPIRWIPIGTPDRPGGLDQDNPGWLDVGIFVDSLTISMFAMITFVAALMHIFSIGYMHDDNRYPRFFTYLGLFCFAMLGLVIGSTLLQLFIFWELIGICSYLMIGFWYEKKSATNAAIKAFVANRVGDVGFLIGLGILLYRLGNLTLPHLWIALGSAGGGGGIAVPDGTVFSAGLLTMVGIGLFFGAIGKSAQFPLHVWLPDAMEGPTPVSALIHAATMVAAGVYLMGRIFPILTPDAKLFIAIIGVVTLTMGALIAAVQSDIKKVLAFSTISQLGYMMLAIGVGSWVGGLFHLITHAFFKALLFLGAGSVIHAAGHEQEMSEFGGLIRKVPVTAVAFLFGVFAIYGVGIGSIGFSGYYSKEMILSHAGAFVALSRQLGKSEGYSLLFILPTIVAFVTPFYMMRCWMLTFWGRPRDLRLFAGARETQIMAGPLIVLGILALISGKFMNVQEMLEGSIKENTAYCRLSNPTFAGFNSAWPGNPPLADVTPMTTAQVAQIAGRERVTHQLGFWGYTVGIGTAFLLYINGLGLARALLKFPLFRWLRHWLHERMYFDELYFAVFVAVIVGLSKLSAWFDAVVIDGAVNLLAATVRNFSLLIGWNDQHIVDGIVNGVADLTQDLGAAVRAPQTGRIRFYVTLLMCAVAMGAAGALLVTLLR